uniref:Ribosomal protein S14 n=1 Tax=Pseudo-nitzschia multiseries TaxID=37319 RepID=A0A0G3F1H1_PSEMU|nr:ribosomal protein S14 [Pseudo-nitzschia multiseries]AKJ77335.1 ribosomal protein S14 [Pseudo-nitzschia multiseries]
MKKLFAKDKKNRETVKHSELSHFILKQISTNSNFLRTIRWNALYKLSNISKNNSKTVLSNRCVRTLNRKTFHKFSNFSRMVYLKLVKSGYISGIRKSSW